MLRSHSPQRHPRGGFTLIELLVVIAIMGILMGLIMAAVQQVRSRGKELEARADLEQLPTSISAFKTKFNRNPPDYGVGPMDTFRLCSEYPTPTTDTWPEVQALLAMFPRMSRTDNGLRFNGQFVVFGPTSTSTVMPKTASPILLDPNQSMVFFLSGGSYMEYLGFAANPTQPFTAGSGQRLPGMPFFQFPKGRMVKPTEWLTKHITQLNALTVPPNPALIAPTPPTPPAPGTLYRWEGTGALADTITTVSDEPWFVDTWGTPFLYLSASGFGSGGDYHFRPSATAPIKVLIGPWGGKLSSFNNNTDGPTSFKESANKFVNHNGVQVISGGPNGSDVRNAPRKWGFGPGGQATFSGPSYADIDAGGDDLANFRKSKLGVAD